MVKTLDRAGLHALLDVVIDEAEKDLGAKGGDGLSLQGAHGPHCSIMFVAGEHSLHIPRQVVLMSIEAFSLFVRIQGQQIHNMRGIPHDAMEKRIADKLKPQPPSPN